ncbi:nuclear transport factor 2 family protein [Actibacterium pelagium]|uniref:SnoaL-like domain-containing protein n=1 Tax=Actibacterium pelagium TaxID=2029103 RepID=A0A917EIT5_9RHOB|nr:nuclear transport factor 2 family protein [Actibacterium pelagium]GGE40327.1 hypothetical protein GCM10011517_05020 [Actibacterium pelagium]
MPLFQKMKAAAETRDAEAYNAMMAEDCVFVSHQNGTSMNRAEIASMMQRMLADERNRMGDMRCLYENDDILVVHSVNDYSDGTREAVIEVHTLDNGKITRMETGATPLKT